MAAGKFSWKMSKSVCILTSGVALGIGAYAAYRYWKKRESKCIDEGFEDVSKLEDSPDKRILVLGLQSSGKTTLISQLTMSLDVPDTRPTDGFIVVNMNYGDKVLNIWDGTSFKSLRKGVNVWRRLYCTPIMVCCSHLCCMIVGINKRLTVCRGVTGFCDSRGLTASSTWFGGGENIRRFWTNFIQDTDLLIFVVDAADPHRLILAVKEIKALAGDERLKNVPIIVVASKQDLPGALTPEQVSDALDIMSISPSKHKVRVLGSQISASSVHPSVLAVKKAMLEML